MDGVAGLGIGGCETIGFGMGDFLVWSLFMGFGDPFRVGLVAGSGNPATTLPMAHVATPFSKMWLISFYLGGTDI